MRRSREEWLPDGRPEHLRAACEASLTRLKLERIDLYQHHRPDPEVPYEDSIGELAKLQKEGKIRHIGVSNVNPEHLAKARALVKVVSVQNHYNVADRSSDDVLAICEREQIAFIPWGPLAQAAQASSTPDKGLVALEAIAKERKIDNNEAALAWLLARSPVMLPIPGTSQVKHLEDNVGAAKIKLTADEMARVGWPHADGHGYAGAGLTPVPRSSASTSLPPSRSTCESAERRVLRRGGRRGSAGSSPCR